MKDLKAYIMQKYGGQCSCGKNHQVDLEDILIGTDILDSIPGLVRKHGHRVFLVSDCHTWEVAGKKVAAILEDNGIEYVSFSYDDDHVEPDERAVGSLIMHFDLSCDYIVTTGSGVLNDLTKILSRWTGVPYMIVGTAPSMDGYASATSSVVLDGLKQSLDTTLPVAIVADVAILKNAPIRMLQSGMGDVFAKYISLAEWRISNIINDEYYCEKIDALVQEALDACAKNAAALVKRDERAVEAVMEGLIYAGLGMTMTGLSRPASGMEHYYSHIWDMRGVVFDTPFDFHGIQCAVGTYESIRVYDEVKKIIPDYAKAKANAEAFSWDQWAKIIKYFLGAGGDSMIAKPENREKYDLEAHKKRFDAIAAHWDDILKVIDEYIPTLNDYKALLEGMGFTETYETLG
ncbi:MAG: sn-glycerol-1-phosphate dehydrogenase, partial [Erysipelotrichaceae bacterium]|nr:sn-glycerol-1-phosphate dehydrogenase [Erysipelotrichaceae bacterium]